ncbi:MAG: hypothetical protein IT385_25370 [Deltaproteobacteria bacterium]|nr:hypothetical protein [Deltaproteobacteria bacterium]
MDQAKVLHDALHQYVHRQGDVFVATDLPIEPGDGGPPMVARHVVALGTRPHPRERWVVADEGAPEIVILERGAAGDLKRYEKLGVSELFIYDRGARVIDGYWLGPGGFAKITALDDGRMASEELRLVLGFVEVPDQGAVLRWFKRDGTMLETPDETEAHRRAKIARLIEAREREIEEELGGG